MHRNDSVWLVRCKSYQRPVIATVIWISLGFKLSDAPDPNFLSASFTSVA
jgi:hypothetical protein